MGGQGQKMGGRGCVVGGQGLHQSEITLLADFTSFKILHHRPVMDGQTDGPTKRGVESRSTRLKM